MVGTSTGWLSHLPMLFPRVLSLTCLGLSLALTGTLPASAQMYPGQGVSVNMRAAGNTAVLYPGGKYGRNVGPLLQPGEKPGATIRLRKPGTYRPRPVTVHRESPAPRAVASTPTPRVYVPPPRRTAPPSHTSKNNVPPPDSAASFVPMQDITSTKPAPSTRVAAANPQPARGSGMDAGLARQSAILFNPGTTELPAETFETIRMLAGTLNRGLASGASRVQLLAYGGGRGDKSSDARRLSLKRALVLRQILIEDGVSAERIDVRAMGGADTGPGDRVDVYLKS